jgi:hypothetical protein
MRKSTAMAGGQKANGKDRHTRARRPRYTLIAVSFHQLFLDGLLPSRARLRFTGSLPIRHHEKLAQSPIRRPPRWR